MYLCYTVKQKHKIMTNNHYTEKAKVYSAAIVDAFNKYMSYADKMEGGNYDNPQGKNRNKTVLYNKYIAACDAERVDYINASVILCHAYNEQH